jgi:predicted dehydrogenase
MPIPAREGDAPVTPLLTVSSAAGMASAAATGTPPAGPITRRQFVRTSAGALAGFAVLSGSRGLAAGPNDKVVIGIMGLGGRGTFLAELLAKRGDTEIAYLCDVDTRKFARARSIVEEAQDTQPKMVQDFRRMLDDKRVDAIVNATPDHWHALGSIMACQAGKDVYVEKPLCHDIWEGRKMVEAARKYQRIVQVGTQCRSMPYVQEAANFVRTGGLGDVYLIRVFNMMQHPFEKGSAQPEPIPEGFDYDTWCGPAPVIPYRSDRRWVNMWDFGCGAIPDDAVHQLDIARFLMGDIPYPDTVVQAGGINSLTDGRETPDTQIVTFEFGKLTMLFEAALWTPYLAKTPDERRNKGLVPNWPLNATRIEVLGTKGLMYCGRMGDGWQVCNEKGEMAPAITGHESDHEHLANFLDCVRSRKRPAADVEQGHYSTLLCHLANISYRVGNRKLAFDGKSETFKDAGDANRYLKRTYRAPWVVNEAV